MARVSRVPASLSDWPQLLSHNVDRTNAPTALLRAKAAIRSALHTTPMPASWDAIPLVHHRSFRTPCGIQRPAWPTVAIGTSSHRGRDARKHPDCMHAYCWIAQDHSILVPCCGAETGIEDGYVPVWWGKATGKPRSGIRRMKEKGDADAGYIRASAFHGPDSN